MLVNEGIGRRIRLGREKLHLSQDYVAKQIRINRSSFVQIEAGKREVSAKELIEISRILGLTADEILNGSRSTSEKSIVFARFFCDLSDQDQKEVINMIEFKRMMMTMAT